MLKRSILGLVLCSLMSSASMAEQSHQAILNHIDISSSAKINTQEIHNLLRSYLGKNINSNLLQQVLNEISRYFQNNGYPSSQAVIPEQEVTNGILQVHVITPTIDRVKIHDAQFLSPSAQRRLLYKLKNLQGKAIHVHDLEDTLLSLSDLGSFHIEGDFESTIDGEFDLHVYMDNAKTFNFATFADNHGTKPSGQYRAGILTAFKNLSSNADNLSLFFARTNEKQNNFNLHYDVPINSYLTILSSNICASNYELAEQYTALGAEGYSLAFELMVKQGLKRSSKDKLSLGFGFEYKKLKDSFETFDLDFKKNTMALITTMDYNYDYKNFKFDTGAKLSLGRLNNDDHYGLMKEGNYSYLNGYANLGFRLGHNFTLELNNSFQLASAPLAGSDQFSATGAQAMAGYDSSALNGDKGYLTSLALSYKIPSAYLEFRPHLDHAMTQYKGDESYTASSAGLDINFKSKSVFASLQVNSALTDLAYYEEDDATFFFTFGYQYY